LRANEIVILNKGVKAHHMLQRIIPLCVVKQEANAHRRTTLRTVMLGEADVDADTKSRTIKLGTSHKDLVWDTKIHDGSGYRWETSVTKHSFRRGKSSMKRSRYEKK
jgi:hypothetical protein